MNSVLTVLVGPWEACAEDDVSESLKSFRFLIGDAMPVRLDLEEIPWQNAVRGTSEKKVPAPGVLILSAAEYPLEPGSQGMRISILGAASDQLVFMDDFAPEEEDWIKARLPKLDTKKLQFVPFSGTEHGLVAHWRGRHAMLAPEDCIGKKWQECLPQGDYEPFIRSWMDDAANLLLELPTAKARESEGRVTAAFAWPWGEGEFERIANGPVSRGFPIAAVSNSIEFAGLAKAAGEKCIYEKNLAGRGRTGNGPSSLAVFEFKASNMEALAEFDRDYFACLTPLVERREARAAFILISPAGGAIGFNSAVSGSSGTIHFSEMTQDGSLRQSSLASWSFEALNPAKPR